MMVIWCHSFRWYSSDSAAYSAAAAGCAAALASRKCSGEAMGPSVDGAKGGRGATGRGVRDPTVEVCSRVSRSSSLKERERGREVDGN